MAIKEVENLIDGEVSLVKELFKEYDLSIVGFLSFSIFLFIEVAPIG